MRLIDLSGERLPPGRAVRSEQVTLTPTDDPATLEFRGFDREPFGIVQILVSVFIDEATLEGQEASAIELSHYEKDGTSTVYENVIGQSVQDLFEERRLQVPQPIRSNRAHQIEVNATGAAGIADTTDHTVTVTLVGLDGRQYESRLQNLQNVYGEVPERRWVYAPAEEVPAQTEDYPLELIKDAEEGIFKSFAASNAGLSVNGKVRLVDENTDTLIPRIRLDAYRRQLLGPQRSLVTVPYRPFDPLFAEVSNEGFTAVDFSFLAEAIDRTYFEKAQEAAAL
jgi:hypothetical protein